MILFFHELLRQMKQYLIVQRESNIQLVLSVEYISHVKISARCPDVIRAMYS